MNKIPSYLVVSRYKENIDWIHEYVDNNYIIYNRGDKIDDSRTFEVPNVGGNQKDIFYFIDTCYPIIPYMLEDTIAFVQGNPFDHCDLEHFNQIIYNNHFTSIEYYGMIPANGFEDRSPDGGFKELNNNWYIHAHNYTYQQGCKYTSFDAFMNHYFINYEHVDFVRFSPGSQYIVEKQQILQHPRKFWKALYDDLQGISPTEGHVIERALYMIFTGGLQVKEEYCD